MSISDIADGAPEVTYWMYAWIVAAAVLTVLGLMAALAYSEKARTQRKPIRLLAIVMACLATVGIIGAVVVSNSEFKAEADATSIKNTNFQKLAEDRYGIQLDDDSYGVMHGHKKRYGSDKEIPVSQRGGNVMLVKLVKIDDKVLLFSGGQELPVIGAVEGD